MAKWEVLLAAAIIESSNIWYQMNYYYVAKAKELAAAAKEDEAAQDLVRRSSRRVSWDINVVRAGATHFTLREGKAHTCEINTKFSHVW